MSRRTASMAGQVVPSRLTRRVATQSPDHEVGRGDRKGGGGGLRTNRLPPRRPVRSKAQESAKIRRPFSAPRHRLRLAAGRLGDDRLRPVALFGGSLVCRSRPIRREKLTDGREVSSSFRKAAGAKNQVKRRGHRFRRDRKPRIGIMLCGEGLSLYTICAGRQRPELTPRTSDFNLAERVVNAVTTDDRRRSNRPNLPRSSDIFHRRTIGGLRSTA